MGSSPTAITPPTRSAASWLNSFDLVRLHKFRELDENAGLDTPPGKLPSFKAMSDLVLGDDKVKAVFAEERIAQASAEFR